MASLPAPHPLSRLESMFLSLLTAGVVGLVSIRLWALFASPLGLGVDEAQYWLWGQSFQFGYYSKPPLIGWLLGFADGLFGSSAAATRVSAPILHVMTALLIYASSRRLGGVISARLACLIWLTLPAVSLGSFVISTDSVMLVFWSAALYGVIRVHHEGGRRWALFTGVMVGFGLLAKYAAGYFIIGVLGAALFGSKQRSYFTISQSAFFLAGVALGSSPTWGWNLMNRFVTVRHLGENANLTEPGLHFDALLSFWSAQAGVIGPICLAVVGAGMIWGRGLKTGHAILGWFIWPVFMVISVQALLKEANANWAVAGLPALTIWVSLLATHLPSRGWRALALISIVVNLSIALVISIALAFGSFGPFTPKSDPLRRLRGWDMLAADVMSQVERSGARTLIAHNRAAAAQLYWLLTKNGFLDKQGLTIVMEQGPNGPGNHYEREYPLTPSVMRPIIALTDQTGSPSSLFLGWQGPIGTSETTISFTRQRTVLFWLLR